MEPFDLAQSFLERSAQATSTRALTDAFQIALEHLGFRYFACCSHVDPQNVPDGAVMIYNYPRPWVSEFVERKLHEVDPVLRYAEETSLPFSWESPELQSRLSAPQKRILAEARAVGLARGYTIPMPRNRTVGTRPGSCSVVADSRNIAADSYFAVQLMSIYVYERAIQRQRLDPSSRGKGFLSVRERQCLELVAQGKSDAEIGQILNISAHTAHHHVERAKRRLRVATRAQAVVRAAETGQISIGDVIRADH